MIQFYQVVNNKNENMISSSPWVIATEMFLKHKVIFISLKYDF